MTTASVGRRLLACASAGTALACVTLCLAPGAALASGNIASGNIASGNVASGNLATAASSSARVHAPCSPALTLPATPTTRMSWQRNLWARTWQFSPTGRKRDEIRIAATYAAKGTARLATTAVPPTLLDTGVVAGGRNVVAATNGDYFVEAPGGGVPISAVIENSRVVFSPRGLSRVAALDSRGALRTAHVELKASARSGKVTYPIAAVNDPRVLREDVVLFTERWSLTRIPRRTHAVIVEEGRVQRIAGPGARVSVPPGGAVLASRSATPLEGLAVGSRMRLNVGVAARDGLEVVNASGHGSSLLRDGKIKPLCSDYENTLRPRTVLAWDDKGGVWLLTSGPMRPDPESGDRMGGSTKTQLAQVAQTLGATQAVTLDGGGSTSMFVHRGKTVTRLDLPEDRLLRLVPVAWTLTR
ncbi:MAG: phosphodiester glycosidase family protein [bacterium]